VHAFVIAIISSQTVSIAEYQEVCYRVGIKYLRLINGIYAHKNNAQAIAANSARVRQSIRPY
jgi:hypothetical protein